MVRGVLLLVDMEDNLIYKIMGAPMGNRNAAGSRGGYKSSGAKKYLRSKMSSYTRKQMSWY